MELTNNADDAGASVVKILLDQNSTLVRMSDNGGASKGPLLSENVEIY